MSSPRNHFSTKRTPRMLKDFLIDDSISCSSSGFKSFSRRLEEDHDNSIRSVIQNDLTNGANKKASSSLLRSRSKAAASKTISAFQAIINTVKSIQFNVVKSPSILPRSLSRKLSKKNSNKEIINDIKITVRVKDIIRWKSFRDLVEEKPHPSDLASSPDHHCTTTTTTTGSTNSTSCSSNGSSWCESDFTSEYLPSWTGNFEGYAENNAHAQVGAKYLPCVGSKSMKATTESAVDTAVGPKELKCEEKEQRSPVSVLDFELDEDGDEHSALSLDQILTNMEKTKQKLMQKISRFESLAKIDPTNLETRISMEEKDSVCGDDGGGGDNDDERINEVEEKAKLLLNPAKATNSTWSCKDSIVLEQLLMDFFVEELSSKRNESKINEIDEEMIRQAKAWIKGEHDATLTDGVACVRDMDRQESWNKFEGEQGEVSLQIENTLLNLLLDELLVDL